MIKNYLRDFVKINPIPCITIVLICCIGFLLQYSAARGNFDPWVSKQLVRFVFGIFIMMIAAIIPLRVWYHLAYPLYGISSLLLIFVEISGSIGMGAKRWLSIGFFNIQASEIMKLSVVLALSKYFSQISFNNIKKIRYLYVPILMIIFPTFLIIKQPDLGTAVVTTIVGASIFFISGVRIWKFAASLFLIIFSAPFIWNNMHEYQKKRVLVFFNPEMDSLGSGYHITQSKITIGSGGILGKGFLDGTQTHLDFLPEKQTDFVFAVLCEEWGFIGAAFLITLYFILLLYNFCVSCSSQSSFGKILSTGLNFTFFVYIFINIGMVSGIVPVVGVPLPFVSYGGTALITLLFSQGIIFSAYLYKPKGRREI